MLSQGTGGRPERIALLSAAALLVAAMVLGGGSRGAGDMVVHLVALPALALGILRWRHADATALQRSFLYVLCAAVALAALQLLPLPAALFHSLLQRAEVLHDLYAAGASLASLPMTIDRWGTVRALLALLTLLASWMLTSTLTPQARKRLLQFVLATAFILALLGFAQAAAGVHSSLRPYDYHHPLGALGSFANRNHFADLMAMLIPLALSMARNISVRDHAPRGMLLWHGLAVVLFLAAALSYSRAGFALACTAVIATFVAQLGVGERHREVGKRFATSLLALGIGGLAVGYYAWDGIVRRLDQDPLEDLRWQYLANGLNAAREYLPWGSGLGSFREAYAPFEPVSEMGGTYALHAHNDLLEVAIEAGFPGLLLMAAVLLLITISVGQTLGRRDNAAPFAVAASIAVFVPLAHSLVDYPLRTMAITVVFGLVLSMLFSPQPSHGRR